MYKDSAPQPKTFVSNLPNPFPCTITLDEHANVLLLKEPENVFSIISFDSSKIHLNIIGMMRDCKNENLVLRYTNFKRGLTHNDSINIIETAYIQKGDITIRNPKS